MERLTKVDGQGRLLAYSISDTGLPTLITSGNPYRKLIEKLKSYEVTGLTPEEIEELKEKQKPKKVPDAAHFGRCPECDGEFNSELLDEYNIMFCPWCGQALDWED